jgi:hypothetical protein
VGRVSSSNGLPGSVKTVVRPWGISNSPDWEFVSKSLEEI